MLELAMITDEVSEDGQCRAFLIASFCDVSSSGGSTVISLGERRVESHRPCLHFSRDWEKFDTPTSTYQQKVRLSRMDRPFLSLSPAVHPGVTRSEVETHRSRTFPSPSLKLQERKWVLRWERTQGTESAPDPPNPPTPRPTSATYSPHPPEPQRVLPPCRKRIRTHALIDLEGQLAVAIGLICTCGRDGLGPGDYDALMSLVDEVRQLRLHTKAVLQTLGVPELSLQTLPRTKGNWEP